MEKNIDFFLRRYNQLGAGLTKKDLAYKPKPTLRVNTLKTKPVTLVSRLQQQKVALKKLPYLKHGYVIEKSPFSLGATTEFLLGHYYLQEAAAQLPVEILDPQPGEVVFDCCAAPGGKTTQIAQHLHNQGRIISYEKQKHRLISLMTNLERCGVTNTIIYNADATRANLSAVDKILVDAPCSGNFALEKNWFAKRTISNLTRNVSTQKELLKKAATVLKKKGTIIYATCSLEPEENELIIDWAVRHVHLKVQPISIQLGDPGITTVFGKKLHPSIRHCRRLWPHKTKTQGFFIAKLTK